MDTHFKTMMSCALHGTMKCSQRKSFWVVLTPATTADSFDIVTIDKLPDDVLPEIFECYVDNIFWPWVKEDWQILVHVCRRWRSLVFGSPRRLNLQIVCTVRTRVKELLNIWPNLPIVISVENIDKTSGVDNVIAALEHNDRISRLDVVIWGHRLLDVENAVEELVSVMQKPFPMLLSLKLRWNEDAVPVFPESFLGGSPRLQSLHSCGIPSPALQKLLLSATDISSLCLGGISRPYLSPEEAIICLSALTKLEHLSFDYIPPRSLTDQESRHPLPPTRIVLPALRSLEFEELSDSEYLEELVARIDAPLLRHIEILFNDEPTSDTLQLARFIQRTPKLKGFNEARISFHCEIVDVKVMLPSFDRIELGIAFNELSLQPSSLAWVGRPSLLPLPTLEHLYVSESEFSRFWEDNENTRWLELFHPFTAVKYLYLSKGLVPRIVPVLQELVGERATEVLPALQNISLENLKLLSGPVQEAIQQLVTARQLSGHPITVSSWKRDPRLD